MKDKTAAGILALIFGGLGVHWFYLGRTGRGILYLLFFWTFIPAMIGFIDGIVLLSTDDDAFNLKYNADHFELRRRHGDRYERREQRREYREERREQRRPSSPQRQQPSNTPRAQVDKVHELKKQGIEKYKDYDYNGAIELFKQALLIDPKDISIHFNLACTYSLNENAERGFYHLDQAVSMGFNDFKRIKDHDALAFLRIQNQFDDFERNGFRLGGSTQASTNQAAPKSFSAEDMVEDHSPMLEQLKKLTELRDKGLLTDEEFQVQKQKLNR
jgi:TM2 domain-containing membrane protein YozV